MAQSLRLKGVSIQHWVSQHSVHNGPCAPQLEVVHEILGLLVSDYDDYLVLLNQGARIIDTHYSRSQELPVFMLYLNDGTRFVMRNNFYDWKVSVNSPRAVKADFMGLFDPGMRISPTYCEGFPRDSVYGPYSEDPQHFTLELPDSHHYLFTFFYIYGHVVLGNMNKGGRGR